MKIECCEFNIDTTCIDIIYNNSKKLYLYIPVIEDSLRTTVYSRSKLDLMFDNEPLEYAQMMLDGTIKDYIDGIDGIKQSQLNNYTEHLSEWYPRNIAEDIARELLMYG